MERIRRIQQAGALTLAITLVTTCAAPAKAQNDLPARLIPEYTQCEVNKQRYACFNEQQMLELYTLEIQAKDWHTKWRYYEDLHLAVDKQLQLISLQTQKYADIHIRDAGHIAYLEEKLFSNIALNEELQAKVENPPRWPLWVGGGLAVFGLGAFVTGLIKAQ